MSRPTPEEIAELEAEAARCRGLLGEAEQRLRDARIAIAPFAVGDEVEVRRGQRWALAVIRVVDPWLSTSTRYRVSFRTKAGEWARSHQTVYGERAIRRPGEEPPL